MVGRSRTPVKGQIKSGSPVTKPTVPTLTRLENTTLGYSGAKIAQREIRRVKGQAGGIASLDENTLIEQSSGFTPDIDGAPSSPAIRKWRETLSPDDVAGRDSTGESDDDFINYIDEAIDYYRGDITLRRQQGGTVFFPGLYNVSRPVLVSSLGVRLLGQGFGNSSRPNSGSMIRAQFPAPVATTISTTSGSATATVASSSGIGLGNTVRSVSVPGGATVKAISGTTLTLSEPATATAVGAAVTFGIPVVKFLQTINGGLEKIRICNGNANAPSAYVEFADEQTDSFINNFMRDCHLGLLYGYDSGDIGVANADTGFLAPGQINGDGNPFDNITIYGTTYYGIDVPNPNFSDTRWSRLGVYFTKVGVRVNSATQTVATGFFSHISETLFYLRGSGQLTVNGLSTEKSASLLDLDPLSIVARFEMLGLCGFQIQDDVGSGGFAADARLIDTHDTAAQYYIDLGELKLQYGGYTGAMPTLRIGNHLGGLSSGTLITKNTQGIFRYMIDASSLVGPHDTSMKIICDPAQDTTQDTVLASEIIGNYTEAEDRVRNISGVRQKAGRRTQFGSWKVKRILKPQTGEWGPTAVGGGSGTTYSYILVFTALDGQTEGSVAKTVSSDLTLTLATTTVSTTNGSKIATVASASGIVVGAGVSSANLPVGTFVVAIVGTTLTLSDAATATATGTAATFKTANRITWYWVPGCSGVKIYGRSSGSEALLKTYTHDEYHALGLRSISDGWCDGGTITPSGAMPTENTTGAVTLQGPAAFGDLVSLAIRAAPASPVDGQLWREDNTNTGLKVRINGVTKTITVS